MTITYFVTLGRSINSVMNDTGPGLRQLARIEGSLGFVPVVGTLLTFPNSQKPGKVYKVQSDSGEGSDNVRIVRVVNSTAIGPIIQTVTSTMPKATYQARLHS